jgi:hypothetical protein
MVVHPEEAYLLRFPTQPKIAKRSTSASSLFAHSAAPNPGLSASKTFLRTQEAESEQRHRYFRWNAFCLVSGTLFPDEPFQRNVEPVHYPCPRRVPLASAEAA